MNNPENNFEDKVDWVAPANRTYEVDATDEGSFFRLMNGQFHPVEGRVVNIVDYKQHKGKVIIEFDEIVVLGFPAPRDIT